ncbi:MAG: TlpA family protein disulfide reductase [Bacteroides sp.]|nr:TlpA family protein disulfide reductase [Bacteroides sp.]
MQRDYYHIDSLQQVFHSYYSEYIDSLESYRRNKLLSDAVCQRLKYGLDVKKYHSLRTLAEETERVAAELILSDSLIHYPSYHDYLKYYFHDVSKKDLPLIETGQGKYVDSRTGFEQTEKDLSLPPLTRNVLLKYYMEEIGERFSGKDIKLYADKYLEISGDSEYYTEIICRYNLLADENQLLLKDRNNRSVTWEDLLSTYKGKVVYVDFWASWCVPCREEIPASFGLHDELNNEEIVFVYLAYNDGEDAWRKTTQSLGLSGLKDSYLIENSKTSVFLRDLSLNLIPRYLIFDKNGELVEANAPRPSSAEIRDLLERYL